MRRFAALGLLLLVTALLPSAVRADDPTDGPPDVASEDGWSPDRFWFAKVLPPREAWTRLMKDLRALPGAQRRSEQARRIRAYVTAFDAAREAEQVLDKEEMATLFRFYLMAERYAQAMGTMDRLLGMEDVEVAGRDDAITSLAQLLATPKAREALGEEAVGSLEAKVRAYLKARSGEDAGRVKGRLHKMLAQYADGVDRPEDAVRHHVLSALEDPANAAGAARTVVRTLQGATHDMGGYDAVRASSAALIPVLTHLARRHLELARESGDERAVDRAERGLKSLAKAGLPLAMLGRPAPEWTLEHAWQDVTSLAELRGKVVVLDFWATWCPWCIRSFPALRDLLRDYGEHGLAVVGVTASANSVYEQRFDLDDDLKEKAGAERPSPVARLDRGGPAREDGVPTLEEEAYREAEKEAVGRFIQNHEMTWPVVMIAKEDPSAKYALAGWPHAVVLDRRGRVRYFKSGALLRDRPEAVRAFREVLEDLLAE